MGQIHPWWDSNDISHLYRSFLNEVNWVLRGPSLATAYLTAQRAAAVKESSLALGRITSQSGRHKQSH